MKYKDWVELSSEVGQLISQGARAYKEIKINIEYEWVQLIDVTLDNTQSQFPPMDKFLFLSFSHCFLSCFCSTKLMLVHHCSRVVYTPDAVMWAATQREPECRSEPEDCFP